MNSPSSWPPNPRDAKHRRPIKAWNNVPATLLMIAICLITAFRTQLGDNMANEDWMYFQSQTQRRDLFDRMDSLIEKDRALAEDGVAEDDPAFTELSAQLADLHHDIKANDPLTDIKSGQVWRLFTPMFPHFGMMHIIFNLYWLWTLGAVLEIRYRSWRYVLLVLAVALVSNTAQALIKGTNFGGMSGVNYGLFGYLLLHGRCHPAPSFALDKQTVFIMLAWLAVCFTGALGPVANWAHLFGFLTGAGAGLGNAILAGGVKHLKRRGEFKLHAAAARSTALHQCAVCGATERENADLEFRVGRDGMEYCDKHLPKGSS